MYKCTNVQILLHHGQRYKCANVQMYKCTNVQMYQCTNVQILLHHGQRYKCINVPMYKCANPPPPWTNVQMIWNHSSICDDINESDGVDNEERQTLVLPPQPWTNVQMYKYNFWMTWENALMVSCYIVAMLRCYITTFDCVRECIDVVLLHCYIARFLDNLRRESINGVLLHCT